jgi:hypothetical protein
MVFSGANGDVAKSQRPLWSPQKKSIQWVQGCQKSKANPLLAAGLVATLGLGV